MVGKLLALHTPNQGSIKKKPEWISSVRVKMISSLYMLIIVILLLLISINILIVILYMLLLPPRDVYPMKYGRNNSLCIFVSQIRCETLCQIFSSYLLRKHADVESLWEVLFKKTKIWGLDVKHLPFLVQTA